MQTCVEWSERVPRRGSSAAKSRSRRAVEHAAGPRSSATWVVTMSGQNRESQWSQGVLASAQERLTCIVQFQPTPKPVFRPVLRWATRGRELPRRWTERSGPCWKGTRTDGQRPCLQPVVCDRARERPSFPHCDVGCNQGVAAVIIDRMVAVVRIPAHQRPTGPMKPARPTRQFAAAVLNCSPVPLDPIPRRDDEEVFDMTSEPSETGEILLDTTTINRLRKQLCDWTNMIHPAVMFEVRAPLGPASDSRRPRASQGGQRAVDRAVVSRQRSDSTTPDQRARRSPHCPCTSTSARLAAASSRCRQRGSW